MSINFGSDPSCMIPRISVKLVVLSTSLTPIFHKVPSYLSSVQLLASCKMVCGRCRLGDCALFDRQVSCRCQTVFWVFLALTRGMFAFVSLSSWLATKGIVSGTLWRTEFAWEKLRFLARRLALENLRFSRIERQSYIKKLLLERA